MSGPTKGELDDARQASTPGFAVNVITGHWNALIPWMGRAPANVPEIWPLAEEWQRFRGDWCGAIVSQDIEGVPAQATNLAQAESAAMDHGYVVPVFQVVDDNGTTVVVTSSGTGVLSPGPLSPACAAKSGHRSQAKAVATPDPCTVHPIASKIGASLNKAVNSVTNAAAGAASTKDPSSTPKLIAVGALLAVTGAATVAARDDKLRAGIAAAGVLSSIGLAAILFSPSAKKSADPRTAGAPAVSCCEHHEHHVNDVPYNRRFHAHTCPCGRSWWHNADACKGVTASRPACEHAHTCPSCGVITRRVDTDLTDSVEVEQ